MVIDLICLINNTFSKVVLPPQRAAHASTEQVFQVLGWLCELSGHLGRLEGGLCGNL